MAIALCHIHALRAQARMRQASGTARQNCQPGVAGPTRAARSNTRAGISNAPARLKAATSTLAVRIPVRMAGQRRTTKLDISKQAHSKQAFSKQ
jgi:hypothetical protein